MTGIVVRLVLVAACLAGAFHLLKKAALARRAWRRREAGLDRAEAWWGRAHGGPFDQNREGVPPEVVPFIGPHGPRLELREPRPAMAEFVWGWVLLVLGVLIGLTVVAQVVSGAV